MTSRFVMVESEVAESLGHPVIIILSDIGFWNDHFDVLLTWCEANGAEQQGMTVNMPSQSVLTAWCLRWA